MICFIYLKISAGNSGFLDPRVIKKIQQFVLEGSLHVGETQRRLNAWIREEFPEAWKIQNSTFVPDSRKLSVHMTKSLMHERYSQVDEAAIEEYVRMLPQRQICLQQTNISGDSGREMSFCSISKIQLHLHLQKIQYSKKNPEDLFIYRAPVKEEDFELETYASEIRACLGSEDENIMWGGVQGIVNAATNTLLIVYQSAKQLQMMKQ